MRFLLRGGVALCLAFLAACSTRQLTDPGARPKVATPEVHGFSVTEEATVIGLEDRREYAKEIVGQWLSNPNPLHRARMALALGRIGTAAFADQDSDAELDTDETFAGVAELALLVSDVDPAVRRTAAFALGEIGDKAGVAPLLLLATDMHHPDVAGEAVEALSKLNKHVELARYIPFTVSETEGVRARAVRFLFRFDTDEASQLAASALSENSTVIRREAAYALSRRMFAPARQKLELLMGDPDPLTRSYVARALGRIAAPESQLPVAEGLLDSHPWVRVESLRALALIAAKTPSVVAQTGSAEVAVRLITLSADPDPGTRAASIEPLGKYARINPAAKQSLSALANDGSQWQRELAAVAIAANLEKGDSSAFSKLLELHDSGLQRGLLQNSAAMKQGVRLRERFATDSEAPVRAAAIGAIPDDAVDAEAAIIEQALDDPDVIVRATAIDRFSLQKKVPAPQLLSRLLPLERRARQDTLNDARLAAITAIAAMDLSAVPAQDPSLQMLVADEDFRGVEEFLRPLLGDKDPMVRRAAADLITEKLKKPRPQYTPLAITRTAAEYEEIVRWSRNRHTASIHLARGTIGLVLLTQDAPLTTWNFAQLAGKDYFNNTTFMRVVPNFVIQGGDPRNDQSGGPGYSIRDEMNLQRYTRGAMGMALSGVDTGGSQFFITHSPQPHLDGGYTIFARVVDGMEEVVDQVERGDRVERIVIDEGSRNLAPSSQ